MSDSPELEALARRLDAAALAYYGDTSPGTALAFHAAKSALLAAVALLPGRRWWRGDTCYQWAAAGLLVWAEPGQGPPPPPRRARPRGNAVRFHSGPGVVPRVGEPLRPWRKRRSA